MNQQDKLLLHEALDRTAILVDNLARHVLESPAVKGDPMLRAEGKAAFEALLAFNHSLGEKRTDLRGYRRTLGQWRARIKAANHSNGEPE